MISITLLRVGTILHCIALLGCGSTDPSGPDQTTHIASVSGRVTSRTAGPLPGVAIRLGSRQTVTGATSQFRFDSVLPGSYTITADLTGSTFSPESITLDVASTDFTNITFEQDPVGEIRADSIRLVLLQPASFKQGSDTNEAFADPLATPKRLVVITQSLFAGTQEVNQAQWDKVMSVNNSHVKAARMPVTNVTYDSIIVFCNRMSVRHGFKPVYSGTGKNVKINSYNNGYRLLTEAEWEFIASENDDSMWPSLPPFSVNGDTSALVVGISRVAWWARNLTGFDATRPHTVGGRSPNAKGLYDVLGNVEEFVEGDYVAYTTAVVANPLALPYREVHVVRGGSFLDVSPMRVSTRARRTIVFGSNAPSIGFRICRTDT